MISRVFILSDISVLLGVMRTASWQWMQWWSFEFYYGVTLMCDWLFLFPGHGGAGALSHHHHGILPRRHGLHPHVWHNQRGVLQRRPGLVRDYPGSYSSVCLILKWNVLKCAFRATQIKTYSWDNAQVIMVGNKCDMDEERIVPPEKGKHLADQLGEMLLHESY